MSIFGIFSHLLDFNYNRIIKLRKKGRIIMNTENKLLQEIVKFYGKDILSSKNMIKAQEYFQHGRISVYEHSMKVAICCLKIADRFNINVDKSSLVRGALLHDYFLYDWHNEDNGEHKWHGFTHAKTALKNASKEYSLNTKEKNMILCHMFPLNLVLPKYKESVILTIADKLCAFCETADSVMIKVKDYY
jgi:uncharacterized protein